MPESVRRAAVVSGYFNPLHVGHLDMMEAARALADALVVIVNNDAQQVLKKGKVITSETDRLRIVEALRVADAALVAVDDDGSVAASLEVIHAAYPGVELVFCNGGDRSPDGDAVPTGEVAGVRAARHRDGLGRRRRDQGRLLLADQRGARPLSLPGSSGDHRGHPPTADRDARAGEADLHRLPDPELTQVPRPRRRHRTPPGWSTPSPTSRGTTYLKAGP